MWSEYSRLVQSIPPNTCLNFPSFCQNFIDLVFGPDSKQLNTVGVVVACGIISLFSDFSAQTRLGVYLAHITSSFSLKTVNHYFQMYNSDRFQHYDYGYEENLKVYGEEMPPEYRLSNITSPNIALFYSANDQLISLDDIQIIKDNLKGKSHCVWGPLADITLTDCSPSAGRLSHTGTDVESYRLYPRHRCWSHGQFENT